MATKERLKFDVKLITDDFKRKVGGARNLLSEEIQRALVAQCVMSLMALRSEEFPDRPIGTYVTLYFAAIAALMIDDRDPEIAREVAGKFGL